MSIPFASRVHPSELSRFYRPPVSILRVRALAPHRAVFVAVAMILPSGFRFTGKQAGIYIESLQRVNPVRPQMFIEGGFSLGRPVLTAKNARNAKVMLSAGYMKLILRSFAVQ
jgi:hypothetical protein